MLGVSQTVNVPFLLKNWCADLRGVGNPWKMGRNLPMGGPKQWRSFKSEIDIRIECKFVPIIQILLYLCARKLPLNISFTPCT